MTSIPLVDLAWQHANIAAEVREGWDEILNTGAYVGGPAVQRFEQEFATFCEVAHCVGVANGTDALELALRAHGVGAGDEVIVPANTFVATAEAVMAVGATLVLADVDPKYMLLDPESAASVRTERTRAVLPVHLYGQPAPIDAIRAALPGVIIIEDAAQAQGAALGGRLVGSLGDSAATSFYPGKNLGAYGDGGAVMTSNAAIADVVRALGAHGSRRRYEHDLIGRNSRLDSLQAVVLSAKLARLDEWNKLRRDAAATYESLLGSVEGLEIPACRPDCIHVWHLYVVRLERRDQVLEALHQAGIGAGIHYPFPVHLHPAFEALGKPVGSFPHSEHAASTGLSLPLFPGITQDQQARVADALISAIGT